MPPFATSRDLDSALAAPTQTTIVVVAAHALVRAGLRAVLSETPGFSVVGEVAAPEATLGLAQRLRPDVVLFDEIRDSSAVAACAAIKRAHPSTCVLALAGRAGPSQAVGVPNTAGASELCSLLGIVTGGRCAGCRFRSPCAASRVVVALSRREQQVALCISDGLSSKQIAAALGIALRTVNTHRESLARKLGASSPAVVTRYVLENRLGSTTPPAPTSLVSLARVAQTGRVAARRGDR